MSDVWMMGRPTGTFLLPQTFLLTGQFLTDVRKGFGPINFPQSGAGSGVRGPGSEFVTNIFVFLDSNIIYRLYKLTLYKKLSRSANESQLFRFILKIVSRSVHVRGGRGVERIGFL